MNDTRPPYVSRETLSIEDLEVREELEHKPMGPIEELVELRINEA